MNLVPYLVLIELSNVKRFSNGLPVDFGPTEVKLATTLKEDICGARNVETQIREKGLEKAEKGEKKNLEGSSISDKKGKFSWSDPNDKKYGVVMKHNGEINVRISMLGNEK